MNATSTSEAAERSADVIVVTWNSAATVASCLSAVLNSTIDVTVHVRDNDSSDGSAELAARFSSTVVRNPTNVGFANAVNQALETTTSPYIVLLNPDVTVAPETIEVAVSLLETHDAGIVGANLRTSDGRPDRAAARRFKSVRTVLIETMGLPRLSPRFDWQYFPEWDRSDSREVPCVNGAFMLMRTDLLRELQGLDDSVFMYLEDLDLCWRVRDLGMSVWFCADAVATHVGGASTAAGDVDQQAIAHLHRLDGTIEFIVRTGRPGTRPVVVALLVVQSILGLIQGLASRESVRVARHRRALPWLGRQLVQRRPPPPVPSR